MVVSGCHCIGLYTGLYTGAVVTEQCAIHPPGDSSGKTTSGGVGEGEHMSDWVCVQLESDFTWDSNLACNAQTGCYQ